MAYRDSLAGVKSKHAYAEYESSLNREIEEGSLSEFAIVVCDVNNLKWVNDNLGHKAGGRVHKGRLPPHLRDVRPQSRVFERADSAMYARKKQLKDAAKGISGTTR